VSLDLSAFIRTQTRLHAPPLVPEIVLHLAARATDLWEATEAKLEATGLPPPYWAFAWPGGRALARLLLDQPELAKGRRVLDFAAGCGIAGIAAAKSGAARVTASEIDAFAGTAMELNAAANGVALDVRLDDSLEALGVLNDDTISRERRVLRARFQLVDLASGAVLLDATAGSDAGIDVVSSEYATIAAEQKALENLAVEVADRVATQVALTLRAQRAAPAATNQP
jgi:LPS-assembly lipoprotein